MEKLGRATTLSSRGPALMVQRYPELKLELCRVKKASEVISDGLK